MPELRYRREMPHWLAFVRLARRRATSARMRLFGLGGLFAVLIGIIGLVVLWLDTASGIFIPQTAFASAADQQAFVEFAKRNIAGPSGRP